MSRLLFEAVLLVNVGEKHLGHLLRFIEDKNMEEKKRN
jgi:hypothetical protein